MKGLNIAIDGPAGAGKSTIARLVAGALGYTYVDTGAMYRAVTWSMLQHGLLPNQKKEMFDLAASLHIELLPGNEGQQVFVNGEDVTGKIRDTKITDHVSQIAAIEDIRKLLVAKQQRMAEAKCVVMDGRDIGTHVLPDAEVKVFLTASVRKRAERRFNELQGKSTFQMTLDELEHDIERRDRLDQERIVSPLIRASDAVLIDSTELTIPEVVDLILALAAEKTGGKHSS